MRTRVRRSLSVVFSSRIFRIEDDWVVLEVTWDLGPSSAPDRLGVSQGGNPAMQIKTFPVEFLYGTVEVYHIAPRDDPAHELRQQAAVRSDAGRQRFPFWVP